MKRTISFKDADKNIFKIHIELENGRLSMSGEYGNGCGQCQDSIEPANKAQSRLVEIWNQYHLNYMKAGTIEQEKCVDNWLKENNNQGYDYTLACEVLEKANMLIVAHPDKPGEQYKYGSAWLKRELPENLETELGLLCNSIVELEKEAKEGEDVTNKNESELLEEYEPQIIALAKNLGLTTGELEDIKEESYNRYEYGGIRYFVGTEEQAEQEAVDYLTNDPELWKMAVQAGNTTDSLENWAHDVVDIDGVGHVLNGWDGTSDSEHVNGKDYTIIRM